MSQQTAPALKALTQGMLIEVQGRAFYLKAVDRTQHADGKQLFRSLAKDETLHLRILRAEYLAVSRGRRWLTLAQARSSQPEELSLFPEKENELAAMIKEDTTDLQALAIAMDFETRGYNMYAQAAQGADAASQKVYKFLAQEENRHFLLLQKTHQYLSSRGVWLFDDMERPMLDGG